MHLSHPNTVSWRIIHHLLQELGISARHAVAFDRFCDFLLFLLEWSFCGVNRQLGLFQRWAQTLHRAVVRAVYCDTVEKMVFVFN